MAIDFEAGFHCDPRPTEFDGCRNHKILGDALDCQLAMHVIIVPVLLDLGRVKPGQGEHGDIEEFLNIGKEGHPIQESTYGVTVGDEWLKAMIEGDQEKRKI